MKRHLFATLSALIFVCPLLGQDPATLSSPMLRSNPQEIVITTRFSNFAPGVDYRLGLGTTGTAITGLEMELALGETALSKGIANFKQAYADNWFNVGEIAVQGFVFSADEIPGPGEELSLKITVPRPEAVKVDRLFVILAKKYGPNVWYIIDGAEINSSHF